MNNDSQNGVLWKNWIPSAWNWLTSNWKNPVDVYKGTTGNVSNSSQADVYFQTHPTQEMSTAAPVQPSVAPSVATQPTSQPVVSNPVKAVVDNAAKTAGITSTPVAPASFTIPPSTSGIPSTSLTPTTRTDASAWLTNNANGMLSGQNSYAPSDGFLSQYFQASQMPPELQQALSNQTAIGQQIANETLAAKRQIYGMYGAGLLSKQQLSDFTSEAQRQSDMQLANMAYTNQSNNLTVDALSRIYQSRMGAYGNIVPFFKPTEISPGSSLVNPATGQTITQGMGASPAQINATALQLAQMAMSSGTMQYNQDGTPNLAPYIGQARQMLMSATTGNIQNGQGMNTQPNNGITPQLQTYLQVSGGQYINEDRVPKDQQDTIKAMAARAGIPYLTAGDLDKFQSIQVTQSNLGQLGDIATEILGSGLGGRTIGAIWNTVSQKLQLDPRISSFSTWRDTAVNTIQALAGGQGSGFRLNQAEIDTATSNLPTITDNIETAQAKLMIVNSLLNRWKSEILTGRPNSIEANTADDWSALGD